MIYHSLVVSFPFDAANDKLKKSKSQYVKMKNFSAARIKKTSPTIEPAMIVRS